MSNNSRVLRKLAYEYYEIANSDRNRENIKLHRAVNDLRQIRPVVLIEELPWFEMDIDGSLNLQCSDPYLREIEWFMRINIYKHKHLPADMVLPAFIPVRKVVLYSGTGAEVQEEKLATDLRNDVVAHSYKDIVQSEDDLERLHTQAIAYDEKLTIENYTLVAEAVGDIIPVKISGIPYFSFAPADAVAQLHGVTNLLIDLAERPDFIHKFIQKLMEIALSDLEQMEALGLFDNDPFISHSSYDDVHRNLLHCTPIHTSSLPGKDSDGGRMTRKDIWGRGAAQIFAAVSKQMHEEFDIEYMKKVVGQCGLVYYGCCEPLDKKIDIVAKIPNLRKISVTPWADVDIAAEAIGKDYVLSSKPNPASVAMPALDKDYLKKEIGRILGACRRNGCNCDIVLKDISTCNGRPQNIFEWEQIAMEMVRNF